MDLIPGCMVFAGIGYKGIMKHHEKYNIYSMADFPCDAALQWADIRKKPYRHLAR